MIARLRRLALPFAGLLISAAALWFAVRSVNLVEVGSVLRRADLRLLAVLPLLLTVQVVLRAVRWQSLLGAIFTGSVPLARIFPSLFIGYLGNAVLPARAGEAIRAYLLARRQALSTAGTFGSVVLERIVDVFTIALLALPAAMIVGAPLWIAEAGAVALAVSACGLILLLSGGLGRIVVTFRRAPRRRFLGLADRVLEAGESFAEGAGGSRGWQRILPAVLLSVGAWLIDAAIYWSIAHALSVELPAGAALLVSAVTVLSTAVPSAPGYLGTFELAAMSAAMAFGAPSASALALAVVAHAVTVIPAAAAGAVSLWVMGGGLTTVAGAARSARSRTIAAGPAVQDRDVAL